MKDLFLIHIPSVEIAVARSDAGIMLRFEGALVDQLLPYTVVGGEIDMLEQLSVQHGVDLARRGFGVYVNGCLFLRRGGKDKGHGHG